MASASPDRLGAVPTAHLGNSARRNRTVLGVAVCLALVLFLRPGALATAGGGLVAASLLVAGLGWPMLREGVVTYELYDDRAVAAYPGPVSDTVVPFDEVAFVVRSDREDGRGVEDFEFVLEDRENVRFRLVEDAELLESRLNDALPTPGEWLAGRAERDTALRALQRRRWWYRRYMHGDHEGSDEGDPPFDPTEPPAFVEIEDKYPRMSNGSPVMTIGDFGSLARVGTVVDLEALDDTDGIETVGDIDGRDIRPARYALGSTRSTWWDRSTGGGSGGHGGHGGHGHGSHGDHGDGGE